ncbi:MAG: hypothetical protein JNM19_03995 [Chitinophagaceae bacterium]|nr:hypothetical protein [Chitinophagaceae bacterium]
MTAIAKYLILLGVIGFFQQSAAGQPVFASSNTPTGQNCKPLFSRQLFHDYVNTQQKNILKLDGKADGEFAPSVNEEINFLLTQTANGRVDALQCSIETDSTLNDQLKKKYLRGLENQLKFFVANVKSRKVSSLILPDIISAYEKCMTNDLKGLPIDGIVKGLSYEAAYSITKADNITFEKNAGYIKSQQLVILKYCGLHPSKIFATLAQNPDMPFADSLIRTVAKKYPKQLYDYSQASNKLGLTIRNITDDNFIATVVKMARTKDGQQYFCFLDNIVNGKLTYQEIDAAKNDSVLYYKLLVKTQIDYAERAQNKDTAFEFQTLGRRLELKAKENFVNIINGLHNERNHDIRFRSIQALGPEDLYYLAVTSDGSMYTSSFVKGVYPLMMKKLNNHGDSLLLRVHFDKYRKFIKISAGFNMLDHFLASFPKPAKPGDEDIANTLMKAFVNNLEKSDGIEDGVDVADSYASIAETLKPVANEMLKNIQANYQRNLAQGNKKGIAIYNILNKLFLSADTTQKINLTTELGIPSVYDMSYKDLTYDSSGKVAIQLFIYGDKDGIGLFPGLVNIFNNSNWKIDQSNKQWVTVTAAKGRPVTLYMNRPLPEEGDQDGKAQAALCEYLEKNNIIPKVTINRGHSYNAPYTIEQMSTASKIVFMGSCGGYRSIHDILEKAPDAHIIGTKQIADAQVNNPFLRLISDKLRTSGNIEWIPFWTELSKIATDPIFADYVPPHKNLGALFIKAYKLAMEEE